MKKILLILLIVFCIFNSTAYAGIAEELKMIASLAQQLKELKKQTTQLKEQASSLKNALKAIETLKGSQYQWGNADALIDNINGALNQADGLFYTSSNLHHDFETLYPGYKVPSSYEEEYKQNVNSSLHTLDGVLTSMGASAADLKSESARLATLQAQVNQAQGQTQAIQASAQLLSEAIVQLQLLRQTLIAQSNAQMAFYAQQIQKEASAQAEVSHFIQSGSTHVPAYGSSGESINLLHY